MSVLKYVGFAYGLTAIISYVLVVLIVAATKLFSEKKDKGDKS